MESVIDTYHAPAARSSDSELKEQIENLNKETTALAFIDSIPMMVTILNQHRQILYSNEEFNKFIMNSNQIFYFGQRTGEALNCLHATETAAGCGTSETCTTCGAVNAIMSSQKLKEKGVDECRITTKTDEYLDMLVWATPINIGGGEFTICALSDIADEKRRKALERIFFHDILNTAGGLRGFVGLLSEAEDDEIEEFLEITDSLTEKLIDEIKAQKILSNAENNELELNMQKFSTYEVLEETKLIYEKHEVTKSRIIEVDKNSFDTIVESDKVILRRIVGNIVKNALEAIPKNETVTIGCKKVENNYVYSVHNKSVMPKNVKLQMFKRSFSTKGVGRGLGTYSVKLLAEKYLKGKVTFESEEGKGTTFWVSFPLT